MLTTVVSNRHLYLLQIIFVAWMSVGCVPSLSNQQGKDGASDTQTLEEENQFRRQIQQAIVDGSENRVIAIFQEIKEKLNGSMINLNVPVDHKLTLLYQAIFEGHHTIVDLLLQNGADLTNGSDSSILPLHLSILNGDEKMVEVLLKKGADVNQKDAYGLSPLQIAFREDKAEIVKLLLKAPNIELAVLDSAFKDKLMHYYVDWFNGDASDAESIVESLIANGANPNAIDENGQPLLHKAACWSLLKLVKRLLWDDRIDLKIGNQEGMIARDYALNIDQTGKIVELFDTRLHEAIYKNNQQKLKSFLDQGDDVNVVNKFGETPLWIAIQQKREALVACLLASPHIKLTNIPSRKHLPLTQAIIDGNNKIIQLILEKLHKLEDLDARDPLGYTALYVAVGGNQCVAVGGNKCEWVIDILLERKVNPNIIVSKQANAPLHIVRCEKIATKLINGGADVNLKGVRFGETPLHEAVKDGCLPIIELLLQNKADVTIKNNFDETPLDLAKKYHKPEIVQLLEDYLKKGSL